MFFLSSGIQERMGNLKTKEAELFNKFDYITPPKEDSDQYTVCDQVSAAWMLDTLLNGRLLSCPGQICEDNNNFLVIP